MARKKFTEQYLIDWRRRQVAEYDNMGWKVDRIATALHVDSRTVYRDLEYIEQHANEIMRDYLIKTVPNILNKSLQRLELVNREAWTIHETAKRESVKLGALQIVGRSAKDIVEIVCGNPDVVDSALEKDTSSLLSSAKEESKQSDQQNESEEEKGEENTNDRILSEDSAEEQEDSNAKF